MPDIVQEKILSWDVAAVFAALILVLPVPVYFKDMAYGLVPVFQSTLFAVGLTFMAMGYGVFVWPVYILPSLLIILLTAWLEFRLAKCLCGFALRRIPHNLHGMAVGIFAFCLIWIGILYGRSVRVDLEGRKKQVIVDNAYWSAISNLF